MSKRLTKGMRRIIFCVVALVQLFMFSCKSQEIKDGKYPFWGDYHKTPINEIKQSQWFAEDTIVDGWDWSLPPETEVTSNAYICLARCFYLNDINKIKNLPSVNFPSNPVISHWVKWRELEPVEGEIDFSKLKNNIQLAKQKGYGSIVRIHFSAIDFAPDWIKEYHIPIRKERKANPKKTNYEVGHPEFHKRYLKMINALGASGIPLMEEVKGLFLGYASPSNGDEGVGPYPNNMAHANDTVAHVIERLDTWANITKGVEHKVMMGGLSNYGLSKGFGIRRGFVEMYLYHIPDEHIGQRIDKDGYLYVDESNPIIANNLFQGEENEEYDVKWATPERDFRFGMTTEPYPYRYFTSNIRLLQMRVNYVLYNEFSLMPDMMAWVSLEMGKNAKNAPDAWCFLRESYLKKKGGIPVKNFERWVYQRDAKGYETEPVVRINHPIEMWMVQPGKYYDYVARKGKKIGFTVEKEFVASHASKKYAIKITYIDQGKGIFNLLFKGLNGKEKRTVKCENSGDVKTATFFIEGDLNHVVDKFNIELHGERNFEPIISFLRVIKI